MFLIFPARLIFFCPNRQITFKWLLHIKKKRFLLYTLLFFIFVYFISVDKRITSWYGWRGPPRRTLCEYTSMKIKAFRLNYIQSIIRLRQNFFLSECIKEVMNTLGMKNFQRVLRFVRAENGLIILQTEVKLQTA